MEDKSLLPFFIDQIMETVSPNVENLWNSLLKKKKKFHKLFSITLAMEIRKSVQVASVGCHKDQQFQIQISQGPQFQIQVVNLKGPIWIWKAWWGKSAQILQ